jgi:hypothetical protein
VETTSLAATPALASCAGAAVHDDPRASALIHLLNFGAIRRFRLWNLPLMGGRCQRRACEIAGREVVPWPACGPSAGLRGVCARAGAELSVLVQWRISARGHGVAVPAGRACESPAVCVRAWHSSGGGKRRRWVVAGQEFADGAQPALPAGGAAQWIDALFGEAVVEVGDVGLLRVVEPEQGAAAGRGRGRGSWAVPGRMRCRRA